jgi:hypothetical protein
VDCTALAEDLGYKNPGSVANRIAKLKKKYKLNLSATTSSPRKAENGNDATADGAGPKIPVTPSKNRVTKSTRGRAVVKKTPTKKPTYEFAGSGDEEMADAKEENDGNEAGSDVEADKENLKVESDHADEV